MYKVGRDVYIAFIESRIHIYKQMSNIYRYIYIYIYPYIYLYIYIYIYCTYNIYIYIYTIVYLKTFLGSLE